jgi:hypothetical protein
MLLLCIITLSVSASATNNSLAQQQPIKQELNETELKELKEQAFNAAYKEEMGSNWESQKQDPELLNKLMTEELNNQTRREEEIKKEIDKLLQPQPLKLNPLIYSGDSSNLSNPDIYQDWTNNMLNQDFSQIGFDSLTEDSSSIEVIEKSNRSSLTRINYSNDTTVLWKRNIIGSPKVRMNSPDLGKINSLIVPIIHQNTEEQKSSNFINKNEGNLIIQNFTVTMGYELELPVTYDVFGIILLGYKMAYTHYWTLKIRINFPVAVQIKHPKACVPGESYSLSMTMEPLDDGEMSYQLLFDMSFNLQKFSFWIEYVPTTIWVPNGPWWCWLCSWKEKTLVIPTPRWSWTELWSFSLTDFLNLFDPYYIYGDVIMLQGSLYFKTPMGDDASVMSYEGSLKEIDFTPVIEAIKEIPVLGWLFGNLFPVQSLGFDSTFGLIFGEKVTATLGVYGLSVSASATNNNLASQQSAKQVLIQTMAWGEDHSDSEAYFETNIWEDIWDFFTDTIVFFETFINPLNTLEDYNANVPAYSGETKSLDFTIPLNTNSTSLSFGVDDFRYYPYGIYHMPHLYIDFAGIFDFLGRWTVKVPYLLSPLSYLTMGFDFLQEVTDFVYYPSDFYYTTSMEISEANYDFDVDVTLKPSSGESQGYTIDVTSLGNADDYITFQVKDLPPEFESLFIFHSPRYNHWHWSRNSKAFKIKAGGQLSITIQVRPLHGTQIYQAGPLDIKLVTTSRGKSILEHPNPSITRPLEYNIPTQYGLDFSPELPSGSFLQVHPQDVVSIDFSGLNLGNTADNVTVLGILYDRDNTTREWTTEFSVGRYTTETQSFSGVFNFTYSPNDCFPASGNYTYELIATSNNDPSIQDSNIYTLEFLPYYNVSSIITPSKATMVANYEREFVLSVTNTGNTIDSYNITADGWTDHLSFSDRIENLPPGFTKEVVIRLSIPDPSLIPVQEYLFRMVARSESNPQIISAITAIVDILEPDLTAPGFEYAYEGSTLMFPQSNLSLGPSWIPIDDNPGTYTIFVNNQVENTGNWISGETITMVMTPDYNVGLYNVTAVFSDLLGNEIIDMVWIQIDPPDLNPPEILPPEMNGFYTSSMTSLSLTQIMVNKQYALTQVTQSSYTLPENWAYSILINWQYTEDYPLNISLFLNGVEISKENYEIWRNSDTNSNEWNLTYYLDPGMLLKGPWNLTLEIMDMSGFTVNSTLHLDVESSDEYAPILLTPPETSISQNQDETISFTATDPYPHHYEIWFDGSEYLNDKWQDNTPVSAFLGELPLVLGTNSIELYLYDITGNYTLYSWPLTLVDGMAPEIITSPVDMVVYEHNLSNVRLPSWTLDDPNPGKYSIYRNGTLVETGIWAPFNKTISAPIYHLRSGIYEFSAVFNDTSGNQISDSFLLTVKDVIAPSILPQEPIYYEPFHTANWFELIIQENHPQSYQLYRNDSLVDNGGILPYHKIVLVDLTDLTLGFYEYTIVITDESGNVGTGSVNVYALDYIPPIIDGPPFVIMPEDSMDNTLEWMIQDSNPEAYSLYQNGSLVDLGFFNLSSGSNIVTYNIDNLTLGFYEFILTVEDRGGLTHSLTTFVQVLDVTPPEISRIGEYSSEIGDSNAILIWEVSENHPYHYEVKVDGDVVQQGLWTGNNIELQLVGWGVGTYTAIVIVTDESGNIAQDNVLITVIDSRETLSSKSLTSSEATFASLSLILLALSITVIVFRSRNKRKK